VSKSNQHIAAGTALGLFGGAMIGIGGLPASPFTVGLLIGFSTGGIIALAVGAILGVLGLALAGVEVTISLIFG
jgi:hypothetical protein